MPEQRSPFDVGFADFVAVLLVETLESILAAHTSQEERLSSLQAAAALTAEEFAQTGISVELVDMTAAQLFPDDAAGTTLLVGGPVPGPEALEELKVDLQAVDTDKSGLTQSGVDRVRDGLALYLARRQLAALKETETRGVPRVFVEGGTLRAKLNFTAVSTTEPEATLTEGKSSSEKPLGGVTLPKLPAHKLNNFASTRIRNHLLAWDTPLQSEVLNSIRRTRLMVSTPIAPSSGGKPEETSKTEVFGEVEIRFRMEQ